MREKLRVAAYAVCVRDGRLLMVRMPNSDGMSVWGLPGGGMEHGEDPYDTVLREVREETGYRVEVTGLLGVDSARFTTRGRLGRTVDRHSVRLVYEGHVTGGELRDEVGGSTDLAAWQDLDAVSGLPRIALVDAGLALWRERPPAGRAELPGA
ncbi:NUDIX hydrolase [Streptomyces sp. NPDC048664]|uniref:NUDIX hydrolase n=1 Tax=Streptomyces sp. NPDC048664 TaxID=3154505 RepID=UPI003426B91A